MFQDRCDAGRQLGAAVQRLALRDPLVLALPRGGVPVAAEVARAIGAPLDLLMVRKIGAPWNPELAVAAIADGVPPQLVVDHVNASATGVMPDYIEHEAKRELAEIARRRTLYLAGRRAQPVRGRSVVVVDDGIATGSTMRAALQAVRRNEPARLVLAVPVAPPEVVASLARLVDAVVCLAQPVPFQAVGLHYGDFEQVSDEAVIAALQSVA